MRAAFPAGHLNFGMTNLSNLPYGVRITLSEKSS